MPTIPLATNDFESKIHNGRRMRLSNLYLRQNPLSPDSVSYVQRPALKECVDLTGKPLRGIWANPETEGQCFYVAGTTLFNTSAPSFDSIILADIPGSSKVRASFSVFFSAFAASGLLFLFDGSVVTAVTLPDDQKVRTVSSFNNFFIVGVENSNKFYWIEPGETSVNPLNFASAEFSPDLIKEIVVINDELWLIGGTTTEVWSATGDAISPFIRISGRVYPYGCKDSCEPVVFPLDGVYAASWVDPLGRVILAKGTPSVISTESVEEKFFEEEVLSGWFFKNEHRGFLVWSSSNCSYVFDLKLSSTYRWSSYLKEYWVARIGNVVGRLSYCGDLGGEKLFILTTDAVDQNIDFIISEVSGYLENTDKNPVPCNELAFFVNYGYNPSYSDNPLVEFRWSDDGGNTWAPFRQIELRLAGLYAPAVSYRSLGLIKRPGRVFEFRFSGVTSFRLDGVSFND
jgi:hypothetical protein